MTPYEVLGVAPTATLDEAEEAYHRLLRLHHPDLHHGRGPEAVAAAQARTQALNAAIGWIRLVRAEEAAASAPGDRHASWSDDEDAAAGAAWSGSDAGGYGAGTGTTTHRVHARERQRTYDEPFEGETWQRPVAVCPFCQLVFSSSAFMKQHVALSHDLVMQREPRPPRFFKGRISRFLRGWRHLPVAYLFPFNLVVALLLGVAVLPVATMLAQWVFVVAMAPTVAVLMGRMFDELT